MSAANVVATIEKPSNHQGIDLPERKNSEELFPDFLDTTKPINKITEKKRTIIK
ncbi:hypothetical protein OBPA_18160 [Polaribacter sp. OB-PA-B3]